jgi:hypothetical protein
MGPGLITALTISLPADENQLLVDYPSRDETCVGAPMLLLHGFTYCNTFPFFYFYGAIRQE